VRRASLDIIGRIATLKEIDTFFKDSAERRRSLLIERLLESKEYAANWANIWTVLLMARTSSPRDRQKEMRAWLKDELVEVHEGEGKKKKLKETPDWSKIVTNILTAQGTADEKNGAVNYVLAHLGEPLKEDIGANGKF